MTMYRIESHSKQIYDSLRGDIYAGLLAPGTRLPSQRSLAEQFNVTEPAAHQALVDLATDGFVLHKVHVGWCVADNQALRDPGLVLAALSEGLDDAILTETVEGIIVGWNPAATRLYGYAAEDIVGQSIARLLPDDQLDELPALLAALRRGDRIRHREAIRVDKDGKKIVVSINQFPIQDAQGCIAGAAVSARDITNDTVAQHARLRLSAILRSLDHAIFTNALDGTITSWNQGAQRMYGYSADEAVGESLTMLIPSNGPDEMKDLLARLGRGETIEHQETMGLCKDGQTIDVSLTSSPVTDIDGTVIAASTIAHDITKRKQVELELERVRGVEAHLQLYAHILHTMQIGLQVWHLDDPEDPGSLRLTLVNRASSEFMGTDMKSDVGKSIRAKFPALMETGVPDKYAAVARGGETDYLGEFEYGDERITRRYFSIKAFPLPDRCVGVALEVVTERKRFENEIRALNLGLEQRVVERTAELQSTNEQLKTVNLELESFAYSVSHDLRSPLRGIEGFSKILVERYADALGVEGKQYLERVRAGTQRMSQLIDDLLKLSRVSRADIHHELVDVTALATEIADELATAEPNRDVTCTIEPGMTMHSDRSLMRATYGNLLGNAWKFTSKHASATITVGWEDRDGVRVYFVRDDGAGFDMQYAKNLFGAFQRMHSMRDFQGTGIGLATVQRVINRHGGRVWAESAVEQGTTVYFTVRSE